MFLDPKGATHQAVTEICLVIVALECEHLDNYKGAAHVVKQLVRQAGFQSSSHPPRAING